MDGNSDTKAARFTTTLPAFTTSNGCPVMRPTQSQREGGNLLLKDFSLLDLLSHFNRERIPERVVHAKGAGAYGEFEVTHDISDICNIDMLLGVGKKTPCVTRFSTTGGERGTSDAVRDPRGMATKFFTPQGNWDWVYLNVPFFFIRDPIKFPGLIHAQKRDPQTNLGNPNAFWDWVTRNHESLHMVMWLYSEYGTFKDYRHMNGYMGHAHKWVMPDGTFRYVHMYWQADAGYDFVGENEMQLLRGSDPDHASRDLYEAIERGDHPTWTAYVQVIDPQEAPRFGYNILDLTKHWDMGTYPRNLGTVPSRPFGKLTLNRNVSNYFAEIEQLAFSPAHLVPGIAPSEDPMLQARMFAYSDAQRYRLGVNYQQIPINRPLCPLNPLLRDGAATVDGNCGSQPGYPSECSPLEFNALPPRSPLPDAKRDAWHDELKNRPMDRIEEVDYIFPCTFWTHLDDPQYEGWQDKMVSNLAISIAQATRDVRKRVYQTFNLVHVDLATRVQEATEKLVRSEDIIPSMPPMSAKL
ncbi:catalase-like domain-containing protein [Aspergillus bertholletiae]|uniref:Catalase-like domain-containing protein n=1 Tax=Aspergillus bertholletiae TaxID=1226010 RepID=A0A5N7B7R6_9EURO|nr:catalase-like domain-containing protein [Aspergillus bertholletiae]